MVPSGVLQPKSASRDHARYDLAVDDFQTRCRLAGAGLLRLLHGNFLAKFWSTELH